MNHKLTKADLKDIQAEVDARIGAPPSAELLKSEADGLQSALEFINGAGRVLTLLTAEIVQALAALIIAVVFAVLEFQRVHHGAVALGQPDSQAALIAFAVVVANVVHPIYALREMRGKTEITVTVGTVRGSLASFWRRITGQPVIKRIDAFHNPTLHVAASVITWSTVLLAVYDILGPLLAELFSEAGLQRPVMIAMVELVAGLGLSIAGVFFLQSAAHEIGVRTLTDAPVSAGQRFDRAVADHEARREVVWSEVQQRYLESKEKAAPSVPFGNTAATVGGAASTPMTAHVNGTGGRGTGRTLDEIKATSHD